jgi:hypothetical protein
MVSHASNYNLLKLPTYRERLAIVPLGKIPNKRVWAGKFPRGMFVEQGHIIKLKCGRQGIAMVKWDELVFLEVLDLSNTKLDALPESLTKCRFLHTIILSHNRFRSIPEILERFPNLHNIDLSHNHIREINLVIHNIPFLECLSLDHNKISTIPEWLTELKSLRTLSMIKNNLLILPDRIITMESLKSLHLERNLICNYPEDVISQGLERIRAFSHNIPYIIPSLKEKIKQNLPPTADELFEPLLRKYKEEIESLCREYPNDTSEIVLYLIQDIPIAQSGSSQFEIIL